MNTLYVDTPVMFDLNGVNTLGFVALNLTVFNYFVVRVFLSGRIKVVHMDNLMVADLEKQTKPTIRGDHGTLGDPKEAMK